MNLNPFHDSFLGKGDPADPPAALTAASRATPAPSYESIRKLRQAMDRGLGRPRVAALIVRPWTWHDLQLGLPNRAVECVLPPGRFTGIAVHVAYTARELWQLAHRLRRFHGKRGRRVLIIVDHDDVADRIADFLAGVHHPSTRRLP